MGIENESFSQGRFQVYTPGLGSVGQYQSSAIPWASSSITVPALGNAPDEYDFYNITKFVTITNTNTGGNSALRLGFSSIGVSGAVAAAQNYVVLDNGESYTGEWRVGSVFLLADTAAQTSASIVAGLTGIPVESVGGWTNWSGNVGIQ
jgi:hypothetical protein